MVNAFANLNYITTNLLIDKQYEDIRNSGKENDYLFVVRNNHFALIKKNIGCQTKSGFSFKFL